MDVAEHDTREVLPQVIRIQLRELERDLDEGRVSPAQYDALVDELLRTFAVPLPRADD